MSAAFSTQLPVWVTKRNGRLVPFEADKISQALFAAAEALGKPDPFLARELTDGVLHFLGQEYAGATPTTAQVAEWVVKVVRELGHPDLARVFAKHAEQRRQRPDVEAPRPAESGIRFSPREPFPEYLCRCRQEYGLRATFSRDLLAAHDDGLLTLTGLESPLELQGCLLDPAGGDPLEALVQARELAGEYVAVDGPEHALADRADPAAAARAYVRSLAAGLKLTGLRALLHLNGAGAPPWADELAVGPLFAEQQRPPVEALRLARAALYEAALGAERIDLYWHISEPDVADGVHASARAALEQPHLTLAFDRPRRAFSLGAGLDRKHAAVLLAVGVHLPRLAGLPGVNEGNYVKKLGSLARLAVSAAVQKRDFLRRTSRERPALAGRFLLDRARLVVVPVGLDAAVQILCGRGLNSGKPATELGRKIVQALQDDVRNAGRGYRLECCLDDGFGLTGSDEVAGVTGWDSTASLRGQVRTAGPLHAVTQGGTVLVGVPPEKVPSGEELADVVRFAWQQTEVARLRFVRPAPRPVQLSLLNA